MYNCTSCKRTKNQIIQLLCGYLSGYTCTGVDLERYSKTLNENIYIHHRDEINGHYKNMVQGITLLYTYNALKRNNIIIQC